MISVPSFPFRFHWAVKLILISTSEDAPLKICCYQLNQKLQLEDEAAEAILPHCSNATLLILFLRAVVLKALQG